MEPNRRRETEPEGQIEPPYSSVDELVGLARRLALPTADLAVLAEGNVSERIGNESFLVKASGQRMDSIGEAGFVRVRFKPILTALDGKDLSDDALREVLQGATTDDAAGHPSVETFMHALLLASTENRFVAHTHPTSLLALLCLQRAEEIAAKRLFPDEIVLCGPASCYVPYADPGLPLARAVRDRVNDYRSRWGEAPKTIWLENHGLVVLAQTANEAEASSLMAAKAARVWITALSSGNEVRTLTAAQIERIHTRPDEHHRQRMLRLQGASQPDQS